MSVTPNRTSASQLVRVPQPGWLFELDRRGGHSPRFAQILEVLDTPGYHLYRVRWDGGYESTFSPAPDTRAHAPDA
jgi:hypothetical protein